MHIKYEREKNILTLYRKGFKTNFTQDLKLHKKGEFH